MAALTNSDCDSKCRHYPLRLVSFKDRRRERERPQEQERRNPLSKGSFCNHQLILSRILTNPWPLCLIPLFYPFSHHFTNLPFTSLFLSRPCNLSLENSLLVFSYLYKSALLLFFSLHLSLCKNHAQWTRFSHLLDA